MAILLYRGFNFNVQGDGTSTSFTMDFRDAIFADTLIAKKMPVTIVSASGGPSTPSTTLNGFEVTFTWATAPAASGHTLSVYFGFEGA